jgi:heat-inducible transcriptional repressor
VRIGTENEQEALRDCSLVLAPFAVEGDVTGTVGVLGPTRMDYQRALAAVAVVSQQLGRTLEG